MAGIVNVEVGNDIPIELLIVDGNAVQFPQAEIRDAENDWLVTLDLVHVASGLYRPAAAYSMPDEKWVTCTYIVYEDAGHGTESTTYVRDLDEFVQVDPDDYKADVTNLDVAVSTRSPAGEYNTEMGYIPADLGNVPTDSELDAAHGAGSWETGAGGSDWGATERSQIRDALGIDGTKTKSTGGVMQTSRKILDAILAFVS